MSATTPTLAELLALQSSLGTEPTFDKHVADALLGSL